MLGTVNFQENMFVGSIELQMMQKLNYQIYQVLGAMTRNFGFIEMKDGIQMKSSDDADITNRKCFKVSAAGNSILTINNPSYAFAWNQVTNKYSIIAWTRDRLIQLDSSYRGNSYFVKISPQESSIEAGSLRIDSEGNVKGTGTNFTDLLRGDPTYGSRIKLYTYSGLDYSYVGTYVVESVNSDTQIKILEEGSETIPSTSVTYYYAVSPTMPLGSYQVSDSVFEYFDCKLEFVPVTSSEIPDEYIQQIATNSFYIAQIDVANNGQITVTDKRFIFENVANDTDGLYSKWFRMK